MKIVLKTDIGQKRSNNEDFVNKYANKSGQVLILLADGLGGHKAGQIASERTVIDLGRQWVNTTFTAGDWEEIRNWLVLTIEEQNRKIYELGQSEESLHGMGTTLEAVALVDNYVIFAHVGDSRIGIVREGHYHLLTSDHSLVNALLHAGQLTLEEAENYPQKNVVLQSVGQQQPVSVDIGLHELFSGDYLVINSDGLTDMISNQQIEAIINQDLSLEERASLLIRAANESGGLDNITLALVQVESEGEV